MTTEEQTQLQARLEKARDIKRDIEIQEAILGRLNQATKIEVADLIIKVEISNRRTSNSESINQKWTCTNAQSILQFITQSVTAVKEMHEEAYKGV